MVNTAFTLKNINEKMPLIKDSSYMACSCNFENVDIYIDTPKSWIELINIREEFYGDIHDQWVSLAEQERPTLTSFWVQQPVFSRVCVAQSLHLCASFCLQLFVFLFCWPLSGISFFDIRHLLTSLLISIVCFCLVNIFII